MCCFTTLSFAAAGDKVYFVNVSDCPVNYVGEANESWGWVAGSSTLTDEGRTYNGKTIYSYTITNEACTRLYLTADGYVDGSGYAKWINYTDARYTDGCYYLIEANADKTWYGLTQKYYNEFYYIATTVWSNGPKITLYNDSYSALNAAWPGEFMTPVGSYSGYPVWKYVGLTSEPTTQVNFNDNNHGNAFSVTVSEDAAKNCYHWQAADNIWRTLPELGDVIYTVVGDWQLFNYVDDETDHNANWEINATNKMWYNNESGKYELTLYPGIQVANAYAFRVLYNYSWDFCHPHPDSPTWHEWVNIPISANYGVKFEYTLANDVLTAALTQYDYYSHIERKPTSGYYGTICLPKATSSHSGATFYSIAGKESGNIVLEEHTGELEAGVPYMFYYEGSDNIVAELTGDEAEASTANGLVGSFTQEKIDNDDDYYILQDNKFWKVGDKSYVGAYRAYLDLSAVSAAPSPAPGRRYVRMAVDGYDTATAIPQTENMSQESVKVIENGQVIIIRDGIRYSVLGVRL